MAAAQVGSRVVVALAFAVTLLLAVLVSDVARRSVLSTAVLFLLAGIVTNLWCLIWGSASQTRQSAS